METSSDGRNNFPPSPLPNGFYIRELPECVDAKSSQDGPPGRPVRRWNITGHNPEFYWDVVVTHLGSDQEGFELHCTRCSHRDNVLAIDDVLRLIKAGAHLHDVDPDGGSPPPGGQP